MKNKLATILPFLRKPEEPIEVNKIAVIANLADQASLLAATIYALVKRRKNEQVIQLIDIRDAFPTVDQYVWMDCGSATHLKDYFSGLGQAAPSVQAAQRAWYDEVVKKSLYITSLPQAGEGNDPTRSVIGQAIYRLVEEELLDEDEIGPYMRLAVMSENFYTDRIDKEDCVAFYDLLDMAYQHYLGQPLTIGSLIHNPEPAPEEVGLFIEHQKAVNQALITRVREISIGSRSLYYLTAVGPEVYGLIRRLCLAKKDFIHMSMGSYGTVLYASIPVPAELMTQKSLLKLMPEGEPSKKFYQ